MRGSRLLSGGGGVGASVALPAGGFVSIGATPAQSGDVRTSGGSGDIIIAYRNTGNSADIKALQVAGADTLVLGDIAAGQVPIQIGSSGVITFVGAATQLFQLVQGSKAVVGAVGWRKRVTGVVNNNYTVLVTDHVVFVTGLTAAKTVTLPASPTTGDEYEIADGDGSVTGTNTLTISGNGSNINGAASLVLNAAFTRARVVFQGSRWIVMNQ